MTEGTFIKDPSAVLDYSFDWKTKDWLQVGETIESYVITVPSGLTKDSDSKSGGIVTVWLSGGTAGENYVVACLITTDNTPVRTDERSILIRCRER